MKAVCRLHRTFDEQEVRSLASGKTMGKQSSIVELQLMVSKSSHFNATPKPSYNDPDVFSPNPFLLQ